MSAYFLRVRNGPFAGVSGHEIEADDPRRAWEALIGVCAEAAPSVCRDLVQNADWQIELLDQVKKPIFRISIIGETVDDVSGSGSRR
jgi:hypothetical protein